MAKTRTSGITVDAEGNRIVNKQVLGETVFGRLGRVTQEEAEQWLATRAEGVRLGKTRGTRPRVTFREAAIRYLDENADLKSIDDASWHIDLLDRWIGDLALEDVCDDTLEPFKIHRREVDGVGVTTVNRSLEIARRILNLAARKWRHPNRLSWLETAPLITMDKDLDARKPYPLSWDEQRRLFSQLPADPNGHMALFKVNTGLREQEVCLLQWDWEVRIEELATSVFILPREIIKNDEDRLVVLNGVARSVIEERRKLAAIQEEKTGQKPVWVFTYRGKPLDCMNNTAWQSARRRAAAEFRKETGREPSWGFANVRVHDLKHTFGRRLRSAGVREETRKVLLGHKNGDITVHYSAVEIRELIEAVERIDTSRETPVITLLRVPGRGESLAEVERKKQRADRIGPKSLKFGAPGRI